MSTTNGDGRTERLLEIKDLTVGFPTRDGVVLGVDGLTLNVGSHERLGVVGESGSGKSVMGLAILGMVLPPGRIMGGSVRWRGENVLDEAVANRVRGREIAMIFQDPMVSLNPLKTVGAQLRELLRHRAGLDGTNISSARSSCSTWWGSPTRRTGSSRTRSSCRAGCASG